MAEFGATAVVTLASDGASCCEPGGPRSHYPAAPLGPDGHVDPTGAGDAFSAGLISGLVDGEGLAQSVQRGLLLSAEAVSQSGARPLLPQTR